MIEVGNRFVAKGVWDDRPAPFGRMEILLHPSAAFGVGYHSSTRALVEALEEHVQPGSIVVDIGTGSGILAIAAASLGAGRVYAMDISNVAVEAARRNVESNAVGGQVSVTRGSFPDVADVDLVVCNIDLVGTVVDLFPMVSAALKLGGKIALVSRLVARSQTGQLITRAVGAAVEADALLAGLHVVERRAVGHSTYLLLERQ